MRCFFFLTSYFEITTDALGVAKLVQRFRGVLCALHPVIPVATAHITVGQVGTRKFPTVQPLCVLHRWITCGCRLFSHHGYLPHAPSPSLTHPHFHPWPQHHSCQRNCLICNGIYVNNLIFSLMPRLLISVMSRPLKYTGFKGRL